MLRVFEISVISNLTETLHLKERFNDGLNPIARICRCFHVKFRGIYNILSSQYETLFSGIDSLYFIGTKRQLKLFKQPTPKHYLHIRNRRKLPIKLRRFHSH